MGELLQDAAIEHWLFGGWAVDFNVGEVTRAHDDLHLAVWLDDAPAHRVSPRSGRVAPRAGWRRGRGTEYERGGVRVELTYLVRDDEGRVVTPLREGAALWPAGAHADDLGELEASARGLCLVPASSRRSPRRADPDDAAKTASTSGGFGGLV